MTETQRVAGVVVSPARTFEDIDLRPTWILPLLLTLAVNLVTQFVVYRVLVMDANFEQVARTKVEWDSRAAGRQNTPRDVQRQIEMLRKQRGYWYVLPFVAIPLSVLSLSIFFFLVLLVARARITFRKMFVVLCWSFIIYRCIGGIFTIAALLVHGPANFFPAVPESWSPTSLAQIISRTAVSPNVYSTISKLDVFFNLVVSSNQHWLFEGVEKFEPCQISGSGRGLRGGVPCGERCRLAAGCDMRQVPVTGRGVCLWECGRKPGRRRETQASLLDL